jgi:hypothetical protein
MPMASSKTIWIYGNFLMAFALTTMQIAIACLILAQSGALAFLSPRSHVESRSPLRVSVEDIQEGEMILDDRKPARYERRLLGSQELLMLPRQYKPTSKPNSSAETFEFPQMNHVSCTILSATPSESILRQAIDETIKCHPLLRAHVEGDGEPDERIDAFQMVRKGDPNPCTFVAPDSSSNSQDILVVVDVEGTSRDDLDKSWQANFQENLDNGSWCSPQTGPFWKLEFHRLKEGNDTPCALLFSFNHAISDQSSANLITDQIIATISDIEDQGSITLKSVINEMPVSLEDSVLGLKNRFSDKSIWGFNLGTISYVAGKAAEGLKNPVILPDNTGSDSGGGVLGAMSIISGQTAGGVDEGLSARKSILQFRTLKKDATKALLESCRMNGVTITNALTAAITLVSSDFIDGGKRNDGLNRNYKILQSLDMRRFGRKLDKGETVACMAGSMDLMHGPIRDRSGHALRKNPTPLRIGQFWKLAAEGKNQTESFFNSQGPQNAVKVFDFAMTISDMNNLVDLTSKSKDSQGRAYSAGVSNVGVYEKQPSIRRVAQIKRDTLKVCMER